jgi:hypothetical protein
VGRVLSPGGVVTVAAADKWLAAAEAIVSADEELRRSEAEEGELDGAEVQLAVAVKEWRAAGRPS